MGPITGGSGEYQPGGGGLSQAGMPLPAFLVPEPGEGVWGGTPWKVLQPKTPQCAWSGLLLSVLTSTTQAQGHSKDERGIQVSNWDSLQPGQ